MLKMEKISCRDLKRKLAREIITIYYNEKLASSAERNFDQIFIQKSIPEDIPKFLLKKDSKLVDFVTKTKLFKSKGEIKRLIKQGAVKIKDNAIVDIHYELKHGSNYTIKLGKRTFIKALSE